MEIIVLNTSPYKEKDGIVLGLSSEGLVSYSVKGLYSQKGQNLPLASPLNIVDITLREGKYKYPLISECKLVYSPYPLGADIMSYAALNLINEINQKLLEDNEKEILRDDLLKFIYSFKDKKINPLLVSLIYLAKVLKISGYDFEVNHCVKCGRKENIVAFSFDEGGFLCQEHLENMSDARFTKSELLLIRFIFVTQKLQNYPNFEVEEGLHILNCLNEFTDQYLGVKLKSLGLFI